MIGKQTRDRGRSPDVLPSVIALEPRILLAIPVPDHVVVVIEENHTYADVIGNPTAPFTNSLARRGLSLTDAHGITHPSQPNYLEFFSGSNQGVFDNGGPYDFVSVPNLGGQLFAAGESFIGYAEDLPEVGSKVLNYAHYDRKHNPWVDFDDVPDTSNRPFTDFPSDYSTLPTVAFVVPNELHNSHDTPIAEADVWLEQNIGGYAQWALTHNSLLIVTWDEGFDLTNSIPTVFYGANVRPGQYTRTVDLHDILRTLQDLYGLAPLGGAITAAPIAYAQGPSTPDLAASSDSGIDDADDITSALTPTFTGAATPGATVKLFSGGMEIGSGVAAANNGAYAITIAAPLAEGVHSITAALGGDAGAPPPFHFSAPLIVNVDRTGPQVGQVRFNDGAAASANVRRICLGFVEFVRVALTDLSVRNVSTGKMIGPAKMAMSYSGVTHEAVWTFPGLPRGMPDDGNYTATLSPAGVMDLAGNPLDGDGDGTGGDAKLFTFFQLAGDANADRAVDDTDLRLLISRLGTTAWNDPADFNGDGRVGFVDFQIMETRYGLSLATPLPPAPAASAPARAKQKAAPVKPLAVHPPAFARKRIARGRGCIGDLLT